MKEKSIRFFSPNENLELQKSKAAAPKEPILTGYISVSGKLVLPLKTLENLGIDPQTTGFKLGMQAGKRKSNHSTSYLPRRGKRMCFH
jgi:hypothetical protein